jgi:hypothetical protein
MLADHFTKPLQGALFRKFRVEIQGIPVDLTEDGIELRNVRKEKRPIEVVTGTSLNEQERVPYERAVAAEARRDREHLKGK